MVKQYSILDMLPEDDSIRIAFQPQKSTDWKWTMANDYPKDRNGLKVFSCFACGGGSTMGYKLAGCEVIGDLEIDKRMNDVYVANHHPKYNFLMDIREFNKKEDLPEELFNLDILDGSPPCTTFSMAGDREDSWGVKKKFREGQAEQTLDDLSFIFIETVAKLRPKVVIMENVEGLIKGNAFGYVQKIYKQFKDIGYTVKHWLLKGEIKQGEHKTNNTKRNIVAKQVIIGETLLSDTMFRLYGKRTWFTEPIIWVNKICPTITSGGNEVWIENTGTHLNNKEIVNAQTFPQDYNFLGERVKYICGMSVPPIMIKRIVTRLIESGIFEKYAKNAELTEV